MDYETKDIVFMLTLDKSTTGLKSAVMAREALRKALNILTNEKQVEVAELVTDAHVSIAAMIRKCLDLDMLLKSQPLHMLPL